MEMRFPEELMDVSKSMPNPESVTVEDVAMKAAVESVPETRPLPCTENVAPGVVVPTPTVPPVVAK